MTPKLILYSCYNLMILKREEFRLKDCQSNTLEFKTSLDNLARPCLEIKHQTWGHTSVNPALERQRQVDIYELEVSQVCTASSRIGTSQRLGVQAQVPGLFFIYLQKNLCKFQKNKSLKDKNNFLPNKVIIWKTRLHSGAEMMLGEPD